MHRALLIVDLINGPIIAHTVPKSTRKISFQGLNVAMMARFSLQLLEATSEFLRQR